MGRRPHLRASLRAILLASACGLGLLLAPTNDPPLAAGVGPLPDCRLDDIYTEPRDYDDWAITQVDWILSLGSKYRPPDLVSVRDGGVAGGGLIREVVIKDLRSMAVAAKKNGTPLVSWSPFRGYKQQVELFNGYAGWTGSRYTNFDDAVTFSARPGHSEHQTGLTIDFVSVGDTGLSASWEKTRTGAWMAKNAWKYGWLMSYPKGKQELTCYSYEPWHYRYVGRDLAEKIHDSGLTIREYLWANFTQVDPACVALPPPDLETPGTPRSCALAEATPSPIRASPTVAPPSVAASEAGAGATDLPSPAEPGSTVAPSPTGALGDAMPLGIAVVVAVLAVLGYALWRQSRRARRRW